MNKITSLLIVFLFVISQAIQAQENDYNAIAIVNITNTGDQYWASIFIKNISKEAIILNDRFRPSWNVTMWFDWKVNNEPTGISDNIAGTFQDKKRIIQVNEEIHWETRNLYRILNYTDTTTKPMHTTRHYLDIPGRYIVELSPSKRYLKSLRFKPISIILDVKKQK